MSLDHTHTNRLAVCTYNVYDRVPNCVNNNLIPMLGLTVNKNNPQVLFDHERIQRQTNTSRIIIYTQTFIISSFIIYVIYD